MSIGQRRQAVTQPLTLLAAARMGHADGFIEGRKAERDRVVMWLNHRCDYGPPCGKCHYCLIAATLTAPSWITEED